MNLLVYLSLCMFVCLVPSGAPQNFTAIGLSPTSVRLQWDPPAKRHRHGNISLYEIVHRSRSHLLDDVATNCTELSTRIDGLLPNTDYSFQLRAYTSKGPGPWNNRLPFRTFSICTYILLPPINKWSRYYYYYFYNRFTALCSVVPM